MSACYMPLYQGDYHRDTGHLTTLEQDIQRITS